MNDFITQALTTFVVSTLGGPIILWLPGETPLHSLFLRRGLAYEMANATSGLLVTLEHRFYGKSIPRFQDASQSQFASDNGTRQRRSDQEKLESTGRGWGSWGATAIAHSSPKTNADSGSKSRGNGVIIGVGGGVVSSGSSKGNNKHHDPKHIGDTGHDSSAKEGLPLDLLEYLTVDQAIEDIVSFIDIFPTLQPLLFESRSNSSSPPGSSKDSTFENGSDLIARWILAGCSYGGNLAAWTRQRYPSKVFAAFASSAPVRSALDFFEYSTSQTDILGPQCSQDLAAARDFLDSALQTTDAFMDQMSNLSCSAGFNTTSSSPAEKRDQTDTTTTQQPMEDLRTDKQKRYSAKLGVLSWFSPDFAHEYAVDGEEVHAAGWIWWTVASAVQYNAIVTPPTTLPAKTAVDVLCETMAEQRVLQDRTLNSLQEQTIYSSVPGISESKALASWFKDHQYFTPTKAADLQASDIDPNSVQNLASMAWLWQTCSELGYLQTSQPSACCCNTSSADSHTANVETGDGNMYAMDEGHSAMVIDQEIVSLAPKDICSLRDWIFRPFRLVMVAIATPLMSAASTHSCPTTTTVPTTTTTTPTTATPCQPCQCYSQGGQRKDSVFSRLLTLEAAWQECQFYFAKTKGQNQSTDKLRTMKKRLPLLKNYPDVERNVNDKFRGWEIAEDDEDEPVRMIWSDLEQGIGQDQVPTGRNRSISSVDGDVRHTQDDVTAVPEALDVDAGTPYPSHPSQARSILESESEFHSGGRYYFTNGENDPWKELTLASSNARAFLSQRNALHQASQRQKKAGDSYALTSPPSSTISTAATTTTAGPVASTPIAQSFPDKVDKTDAPSPLTQLELHCHVEKDHCHHHHHRHGKHRQQRQSSRHRHKRPYRPISDLGSILSSASQKPHSTPNSPGSNIAVRADEDDNEDYDFVDSTLAHSDVYTLNGVEGSSTEDPSASPSLGSTPPPPVKVVPESPSAPQTSPTLETPLEVHLAGEGEDELGDRNVMRIIPSASHCQDILYESTDLDSIELREERQHVLKTFVRWIAIDVKRQEQRRQRQTTTSATGNGADVE